MSRYRRYVRARGGKEKKNEENEERLPGNWERRDTRRDDEEGEPGQHVDAANKDVSKFLTCRGFLAPVGDGWPELSFSSRGRDTWYIFMTGLPGLLTPSPPPPPPPPFLSTFPEIPS